MWMWIVNVRTFPGHDDHWVHRRREQSSPSGPHCGRALQKTFSLEKNNRVSHCGRAYGLFVCLEKSPMWHIFGDHLDSGRSGNVQTWLGPTTWIWCAMILIFTQPHPLNSAVHLFSKMIHLHRRKLNVGLSSMVVVSSSYDHHHIVAVQGNGQQYQHQRNHKHSSFFLIRERYPTPTSQKSKGTTNDLDWSGSSVSALNWVKLWSEWAGQRSLIELIDIDAAGVDLVFCISLFLFSETLLVLSRAHLFMLPIYIIPVTRVNQDKLHCVMH